MKTGRFEWNFNVDEAEGRASSVGMTTVDSSEFSAGEVMGGTTGAVLQ